MNNDTNEKYLFPLVKDKNSNQVFNNKKYSQAL